MQQEEGKNFGKCSYLEHLNESSSDLDSWTISPVKYLVVSVDWVFLESKGPQHFESNHLTDLYRKEETISVAGNGCIHSPRFPSSYPRNLLLTWRLHSPETTRIQLAFDNQFGLEEPENDICRYDFVEVEDVSETSTVIRGRWCGHKEIPPRITSRTNHIKITFKSDDYFVAKPGFKICYSLVCSSKETDFANTQEMIFLAFYVSVVTKGTESGGSSITRIVVIVTFEDMSSTISDQSIPHFITNKDVAQKFLRGGHLFFNFLIAPDSTMSDRVNGICEPWGSMFADLWQPEYNLQSSILMGFAAHTELKCIAHEWENQSIEEENWLTLSSKELICSKMQQPKNEKRVTDSTLTAEALDQTIAAFDTVEDLLKHFNPDSWQEDLENLYTDSGHHYRGRSYHDRKSKVDLDRLNDDVKRYSCTPRNYSVNLREELKMTNVVFFPRCLLVQRCGGNCGCGTPNWKSCMCMSGKTVKKYHEESCHALWFSMASGLLETRENTLGEDS
ncbi:hypothetical protein BTVI_119981 [Pitangus sulphuratus]|nr:hypothetical protein BTVI_119981 [Pitangus sulphuratus]